MSFPGLLVAATASHDGKTTACLGLAAAFSSRGYNVLAAKAGPDYIDAAWLAHATKSPVLNIDLWMCGNHKKRAVTRLCRRLDSELALFKNPLLLVEGAMGLYDGDADGNASSAELATTLGLPVFLLINARGRAQSCAAVAEGFLSYTPPHLCNRKPLFLGIAVTHVGSQKHRSMLIKALGPVLARHNVPLFGFLPAADAPRIGSRHLGLRQAVEEAANIDLPAAGAWIEKNIDVSRLLRQLNISVHPTGKQASAEKYFFPPLRKQHAGSKISIAIARDEAFAFCYADTPALLEELGARPIFFSPLRDEAPPSCDAFYFPGGYPELYAEKLSANISMRMSLKKLAVQGIPFYGECGGYIYFMNTYIDTDARKWPFTGLLPLVCHMRGKLAALGYRKCSLLHPPGNSLKTRIEARGHEFHYVEICGNLPETPLWHVTASNGSEYEAGCQFGNILASWIHLYPEGSCDFWKYWLSLAVKKEGCANG